jgi:hypothetical protein
MEGSDEDTEREAKAFRPKNGPLAIVVLSNLVLAVICLGVPYYRGHLAAEASLRAFSRFAGCMLGAKPNASMGLGLPIGERSAFAGQMLLAAADWPGRCKPPLGAVAPTEAVFLWPSVKVAGADVRAVVRLLDQELAAAGRMRRMSDSGRVPERPMLALSKLRGVLTLYARATNTDASLDRDAVTLPEHALIAEPARLPLSAGGTAALQVWAGEDGLRAIALDARGISWLSVQGGTVDRNRIKRTSLIRMPIRGTQSPMLVWAMSQDRCDKEDDRCTRHTSGIAAFDSAAAQAPTPTWLGGHPAGRADRSFRIGLDQSLDMLARVDVPGMLEVRRYQLTLNPPRVQVMVGNTVSVDDAPAPLSPLSRIAVPSVTPPASALLLQGPRHAVAYVANDVGNAQGWFLPYGPAQSPIALGTASGTGGWVATCEGMGGDLVVFGTHTELAITRVGTDGVASPLLPATLMNMGEPLHPEDPARDRVRMLCGAQHATIVAVDAVGDLRAVRCTTQGCEQGQPIARDVTVFDAVSARGVTLVAYARKRAPQIVVTRLDEHLAPIGPPQTPAACWDPVSGMCGQPTLVADSGRLLLCARDGSDLLAIESDDSGIHWKPMSGLKVKSAISTDVSAPMDQHRLRKGIE